jgi:hypothetical protein
MHNMQLHAQLLPLCFAVRQLCEQTECCIVALHDVRVQAAPQGQGACACCPAGIPTHIDDPTAFQNAAADVILAVSTALGYALRP